MSAERVVEGKARAAARRASLTEAQREEVTAFVASLGTVWERWFMGEGTAKGRQRMYVATEAEFAAWKAAQA